MSFMTEQKNMAEKLIDMLEPMVRGKMEGDICARLEAEFGSTFQRALQGSPFHAGLLLDDTITDDTQRILGIVIKTAEYQMIQRSGAMLQVFQVELDERQRDCDILILGWPCARRSEDFWTVLKRDKDVSNRLNITNRYFGGIENTIPPPLWPLTASVQESLDKIRKLLNHMKNINGEQVTECIE